MEHGRPRLILDCWLLLKVVGLVVNFAIRCYALLRFTKCLLCWLQGKLHSRYSAYGASPEHGPRRPRFFQDAHFNLFESSLPSCHLANHVGDWYIAVRSFSPYPLSSNSIFISLVVHCIFLCTLPTMAGRLSFWIGAISLYSQYVSGQATTSASAVVPTFSGQLIPAHVYPPLTVTGQFPW